MLPAVMNKLLALSICVISLLALSRVVEGDSSHQCHELYEYDASKKGEVTSPFYYERDTHHEGLWCEYRIRAPEGSRIRIKFKSLHLDDSYGCRTAMLVIYSKDKKSVLGMFCGKDPPYPLMSLPGENEIMLLFRTEYNVTGKGFVLEYESGPNLGLCDEGMLECRNRNCFSPNQKCDDVDDCGDGTDEENCPGGIDTNYQCHDLYEYDASKKGEVTSPFFYDRIRYNDGLWCEYRIRAPEGNRIKVSFKEFDISPSGGCSQDQLVVYSKDKQSVLGIFCGTEFPRPLISLPGENEIRLLFRSDFMVSGKGFVMEYESGPNLELCEAGKTECKNRNCYDPKQKCDGEDDCGDGSDEEDCGFPLVVEPERCGTPIIQPKVNSQTSPDRMVGGDIVVPNSFPWQVSLQSRWSEPNGHFCGGTLINAQWVVTATHCVVGFINPGDMKIVLGAHHKYKRTKYEQIRYAAKIIAYPNLEGEDKRTFSMTNDITVVKLNAPVKFNDGVQPACLPSLGSTAQPGWHCYVTGWGETRGSGGSDELKQQEQIVQSNETCSFDQKTQICLEQHKQSPCHGDSGGPLQCRLDGKWFVYGAASYVTTTNYLSGICTGPGAKTVYSNVGDKVDWIKGLVNKYS